MGSGGLAAGSTHSPLPLDGTRPVSSVASLSLCGLWFGHLRYDARFAVESWVS